MAAADGSKPLCKICTYRSSVSSSGTCRSWPFWPEPEMHSQNVAQSPPLAKNCRRAAPLSRGGGRPALQTLAPPSRSETNTRTSLYTIRESSSTEKAEISWRVRRGLQGCGQIWKILVDKYTVRLKLSDRSQIPFSNVYTISMKFIRIFSNLKLNSRYSSLIKFLCCLIDICPSGLHLTLTHKLSHLHLTDEIFQKYVLNLFKC